MVRISSKGMGAWARVPRRAAANRMLAIGAVFGCVACGSSAEVPQEQVAVSRQALSWRPWSALANFSSGFTGSPGLCDARTGKSTDPGFDAAGEAFLGRSASNNRFYILLYQWLHWSTKDGKPASGGNWAELGANVPLSIRSFTSKPVCYSLDALHTNAPESFTNQFAVLGKGTDNKYYISVLKLSNAAVPIGDTTTPVPLPTVKHDWAAISNDTLDSAPAVIVTSGLILVVGRKGTGLKMYVNALTGDQQNPYVHSWQSYVTPPALPSGWTLDGDPAMADTMPLSNEFMIAVRAKNSAGAYKLYYLTTNGSGFQPWVQFPTPNVSPSSEPAVEVDLSTPMVTMYFRDTSNKIRVGSAPAPYGTWTTFPKILDDTFASDTTPSAIGNTQAEGNLLVAARKSTDNQIWWAGPVP